MTEEQNRLFRKCKAKAQKKRKLVTYPAPYCNSIFVDKTHFNELPVR